MILDYRPPYFTLAVDRGEGDPAQLMSDHGLDFSAPASTPQTAVLFTEQPYAAAAFREYCTPAARQSLGPIFDEIEASWALKPASSNWPGYLVPDGLEPYDLQLADIEYVQRRQHALVADEPGVGKTPTAIMWANLLGGTRPSRFRALVICPASIRLQWADRIRLWSTIPNVQISVVSTAARGVPSTTGTIHYTVMSYEAARNLHLYAAIMANSYDLLILDEAHYVKNPTTGRARSIFGAADKASCIADRAEHILPLTGTPTPNRPREAYTLSRALCHEAIDWMSERAFNERFNPKRTITRKVRNEQGELIDTGRIVGVQEGVGRYFELQARLRAGFMVRHLFEQAYPQLRLPAYDLVYAEETSAVRAALEAERLLEINPETFTGIDGKIDGSVSTARLKMGLAIAPQAINYIKMLLSSGVDKLVVFTWHKEVTALIAKSLDKFEPSVVDGSTSEAQKAKAIVRFQTDPGCKTIIGNVLSLGTGTDGLQRVCRHCVLVEPDWVHGNNEQCIKRLHRGGQTNQVQADIMLARGSLAEHVFGSSLRKGNVVHSTLDRQV